MDGANAPGAGGWLSPKNPAVQSSPAFTGYKLTVSATATGTTTVKNPNGTVASTAPAPTAGSFSAGSVWDLTPGAGIMAGHAALVTPHWDPNTTATVVNADGASTTKTGAFVIPPPNTQVSDADFMLDGSSKEAMSLDITPSNGQVAVGFDMLLVGMSGDANPATGTAGEV